VVGQPPRNDRPPDDNLTGGDGTDTIYGGPGTDACTYGETLFSCPWQHERSVVPTGFEPVSPP